MPDSTALTAMLLRHAIAQVEASSSEELTERMRDAAADISARAADPEPLLAMLAAHESACREQLALCTELRRLASADPLTGLRHHRPLADRLANGPIADMALLVIDVDSFKTVNDTHGHPAGDRVLVALATALQQALCTRDELYRVGGDEFVALARVSDPDCAGTLARSLRAAAHHVGLTISIGIAVATPAEDATAVLRRADAALYAAKAAGRDTVHLAGTRPAPAHPLEIGPVPARPPGAGAGPPLERRALAGH